MKKFLVRLAIFAVILVTVDFIGGWVFSILRIKAIGGSTARDYYITNTMEADVLIMGSSRAIHHYDPRIIEDSLGLACYNCGRDGMGILYNYGLFKIITQRYTPKMIIYDLNTGFDLNAEGDNLKYLSDLKLYYDNKSVRDMFDAVDETEKFKMNSQLYRLCGKWLIILSDCVKPQYSDIKGYRPSEGVMNYETDDVIESTFLLDLLKLSYMQRLIDECKSRGIELVFVISPLYKGVDAPSHTIVKELAQENGLLFIDYYAKSEYSRNRDYFCDTYHMNATGTELYTKELVSIIK